MENKNSIYNLMDKLPFEVQRIIDSFWSWKNYYTDNIIYHLNYDLSINHFIEKVVERKIIDCPYLSNELKNKYHYVLIKLILINVVSMLLKKPLHG